MVDRRRRCDVAIIGLGLAGASLAWQAHQRGLDILIIDDVRSDAASRVAAGLVTPVTGAKLKPQPGFAELVIAATDHYRQVADLTGVRAYCERPAIRLLAGPRELDALAAFATSGDPLIVPMGDPPPSGIRAHGVTVVMPAAGRLAIADYVDATRRFFADRGAVIEATVPDAAVTPATNGVDIDSLGIAAAHAVFCRGYRDHDNVHFAALRWRAAKGQILVLDCADFDRRFTVHGSGIWLTAAAGTSVLAGATYEWDALDATSTVAARDKLVAAVDSILELPYTIVDQRAAVRPIVEGRMPVTGPSSQCDRIWIMNGLASKGALFAPTVARHLVSAIADGGAIPEVYRLAHRVATSS